MRYTFVQIFVLTLFIFHGLLERLRDSEQNLTSALRCKINLNAKDERGYTIFMWACAKGFIDLVQILLGNAPNTHIDLNATDEEGRTALMWACLNMNYEVVTVLIDFIEKKRFNIHLNIKDNVGETAFMMACRNGQIGIAKLLLKRINIIIPSRE